MIYVAVGTQKFQFNRLLRMVDELVKEGVIKEEVFAQIGHSDYQPQCYRYKDFLEKDEFENYVRTCNLLITHSGVATIVAGLKNEKPVIVVPRLERYGEHVDDHQIQIADSFSKQKYVILCDEESTLEECINKSFDFKFTKYVSRRDYIIQTVKEYLHNCF